MDFVILKVNGQDVSNSSHEDAVRCFQSAQEPIIVEVLRRQPSGSQSISNTAPRSQEKHANSHEKNDDSRNSRNNQLQTTDDKLINEDGRNKESSLISPFPPLVSTGVQTDWSGLIDEEDLIPQLNEDERVNESLEDFLVHDIDFEEVTLRRGKSAEKLGLTVCYSSGSGSEDADTEVYISEIVPESLAAKDGRLREGDQILRVNGKDVANKEQTENLFAETKNTVTILVSRCLYQDEEYDERRLYQQNSPPGSPENLPAYQNSMIEQLIRQQQQQTEERTKDNEGNVSSLTSKSSTGGSQAPPIPSHTVIVSQQQQQVSPHPHPQQQQQQQSPHPQQQQPPPPPNQQLSNTSPSTLNNSLAKSLRNSSSPHHQANNEDNKKQWLQETLKECTKKMDNVKVGGPIKLLESYSSHIWSDTEHIYETIPESDTEPIYSFPYEHEKWDQQQQQQQLQANSNNLLTTTTTTTTIISTTTTNSSNQGTTQLLKPWHSSSKSNSSGEEKDSSSAYNTGESCHSNPLTLELHQADKEYHKSTLVLCPPKIAAPKLNCNCPLPVTNKLKGSSSQTSRKSFSSHSSHYRDQQQHQQQLQQLQQLQQQQQQQQQQQRETIITPVTDTMYTNVANLQQTMLLQQQLFKQALNRRNLNSAVGVGSGTKKSKSHGNFQAPNLTQYHFIGSQQLCTSTWIPPSEDNNDVQMEWKVKRRADGTRYIARRPVRNRILRNRALKISEERAGHTTEDDTMSEMKVGRYWSKEERKRQLERARERKQRQQELLLQQQQQQLQQQQIQQNSDLFILEHADDNKLVKKPLNIVELSQKKMARKKTPLDDFTTVQEMLVHGNRVGTGGGTGTGGKLMGLLSVTTV